MVTLGSGVAVGALPALRLTGRRMAEGLRGPAGTAGGYSGVRLRAVLVAAQLTLAVVLGVGASLLFNSFMRVITTDPGFDPHGLTVFWLDLQGPDAAPEGTTSEAWDGLLDEVRAVPGLTGVAAVSTLPFRLPNWAPAVLLPDEPPDHRRTGVAGYVVTPNFFAVAGIPVTAGRALAPTDRMGAPTVVVVNRAFVRDVLAGREPLGQEVRFRGDSDELLGLEIMGVVGDVVQTRAEEGYRPAVYVPYTQHDWPATYVVVRSKLLAGLSVSLREAAARFNPTVPVLGLGPMTSRIHSAETEPRFQALLIGSFAVVAVLLAAIGLYGTMAYSVSRRTRELGIRMALGADAGGIFRLVLTQGLLVTVAGLLAGLGGAAALTRLLQRFLFGVGALDPMSFGAAAMVLVVAAVLAILVPARRASSVDVVGSLRAEQTRGARGFA